MSSYKPDGYTSVAPYLIVDDAAGTIEFLVQALSAVELRRFPAADGKIMHAEVRIDDTVVMLADNPSGEPAVESHVHVYVPDVDAAFRRAIESGATVVQEPVKKDDPDKRGGVKDRGGTVWWLSTQMG